MYYILYIIYWRDDESFSVYVKTHYILNVLLQALNLQFIINFQPKNIISFYIYTYIWVMGLLIRKGPRLSVRVGTCHLLLIVFMKRGTEILSTFLCKSQYIGLGVIHGNQIMNFEWNPFSKLLTTSHTSRNALKNNINSNIYKTTLLTFCWEYKWLFCGNNDSLKKKLRLFQHIVYI